MSTAEPIINHDEIRKWVEVNNERPACVKGTGTGTGKDPGILRIDFDEREEGLQEIAWDTWFEWFDKNELALLKSDTSRFNKLVQR